MNTFRKRPVVVEAFQFTAKRRWDNVDWPAWLNDAWQKAEDQPGAFYCLRLSPARCFLVTLEGEMEVMPDDWIIKGVKGELYPCKPDIFALTYEPCEVVGFGVRADFMVVR